MSSLWDLYLFLAREGKQQLGVGVISMLWEEHSQPISDTFRYRKDAAEYYRVVNQKNPPK